LVGLLLAMWRGSRSRGIVEKAVPELAGVPSLASVATFKRSAIGMPIPSIRSDDEFRLAAIALLVNSPLNHAIAVASLTGDESISAVTFRLARALAVSGFRVVLIDAGETTPTVAEAAGLDDEQRSSDVVSGTDIEAIPLPAVQGVEILRADDLTGATGGPGRSVPKMRDLVDRIKATTDLVLVNTPSLDSATGLGQLLSADSIVLVVDERSVKERDLARARQMIGRINVDLLGIITVRPAKHSERPAKPRVDAKTSPRGKGSAGGGSPATDRPAARTAPETSKSDASLKDSVAGRANAGANPLLPRAIKWSD
jgi:Mrp family chromosome partitioning ATPase